MSTEEQEAIEAFKKEIKVIKTERGFELIKFTDRYDAKCSLQQSSVADYAVPGTSAVWLGVDVDMTGKELERSHMHLSLHQIRLLLPKLLSWAATGSFEGGQVIAVKNCARCGEDHDMQVIKMERPHEEYDHWALCPVNSEPIMVQVIDDGEG